MQLFYWGVYILMVIYRIKRDDSGSVTHELLYEIKTR